MAGSRWEVVSRVGPSTRLPPGPESTTSAPSDGTSNGTPVAIVVVAGAVSALLCLCIGVLMWRSIRRSQRFRSDMSGGAVEVGNPEQISSTGVWKSPAWQEEEEAGTEGDGRRRSAQRVAQLVVMAGEHTPSFLAHPAPAPTCHIHVTCPPLHLY